MGDIHAKLNWVNLTPQAGHFTFGYYDRPAFDDEGKQHLALQIPQQDRLPEPGETATLGVVDRESCEFRPIAETLAWGHQVGCLSQFWNLEKNTVVYNDFVRDGNDWKPVLKIHHLDKGAQGEYEGHIYRLSNNGQWASSINFGRIPRRGYSFANAPLKPEEKLPRDLDAEGLFLMDMNTGRRELIASYRQLMDIHPRPYDLENRYFWVNQGTFNSDDSRVMVLFRYVADFENYRPWCTDQYTMNLDGSDCMCSLSHSQWTGVSHQIWGRSPREILLDANWCGRGHQYVTYDEEHRPIRAARVSDGMGPPGHLNFSPDGKWLVADTYPSLEKVQQLSLVHVESGECKKLGDFNHKTDVPTDMRCDLHPRWSHDGRYITVDTIHLGERKIFMLDVEEAKAELFPSI